jgi:hypothetical protein
LFDYPENSKIAIQKVSFLLESQVIDLNPWYFSVLNKTPKRYC